MTYKRNNKISVIILSLIAFILITTVYMKYKNPEQDSHRRFGVTYMTMNNPFYEVINNELRKIIENNGDQLMTLDPALDINKQNEQINYFIEQNVDGIFVNPIDAKKIEPALKKAKKAKIPVIVVDAPVQNDELVLCTIVSDNYDAGVQCANDMMKRMDSARIILLKHSTAQSAKDRIDGFLDTIKNHSKYQVIDEAECEGQLELAMPVMSEMLKETHNVDVIMALNDPSALGALAAIEAAQKKDVLVYGVDGTPDLKSLINQSHLIGGTVAQSPIQIGKTAAKNMYDYLEGKEIEKNIIIPVTLINTSNIDQYDETGWQ